MSWNITFHFSPILNPYGIVKLLEWLELLIKGEEWGELYYSTWLATQTTYVIMAERLASYIRKVVSSRTLSASVVCWPAPLRDDSTTIWCLYARSWVYAKKHWNPYILKFSVSQLVFMGYVHHCECIYFYFKIYNGWFDLDEILNGVKGLP